MKRQLKQIAAAVSIIFALSGCGAANNAASSQNIQQDQAGWQNQGGSTTNGAFGMRGNGQMETADLIGEVSSVSGNEISVKVVKMPQMGWGRRDRNSNGNTSQGAIDQGQPAQGPNMGNGRKAGQGQASGDNNGQAGVQGQAPGGNNSQAGVQGQAPGNSSNGPGMKREYTGETKVLKITDSVSITKTSRGENGMTTQTLKVSDIKTGDLLQVYYSDKTKGTISKITVGMGMGGMRRGGTWNRNGQQNQNGRQGQSDQQGQQQSQQSGKL